MDAESCGAVVVGVVVAATVVVDDTIDETTKVVVMDVVSVEVLASVVSETVVAETEGSESVLVVVPGRTELSTAFFPENGLASEVVVSKPACSGSWTTLMFSESLKKAFCSTREIWPVMQLDSKIISRRCLTLLLPLKCINNLQGCYFYVCHRLSCHETGQASGRYRPSHRRG